MMRDEDPGIIDQAIGWHVRQGEMSDADWMEFIAWLEQSPAHAEAYDRIANQDHMLPRPALVAAPANDDRPSRKRWPLFAGGAVAAAVALALAVPMLRTPSSQTYVVETRPGQRQAVQLADGSRIELSGGSRLQLDRADPRIASLEAGEALFTVRHDAAHPFTLRSGSVTLRDLGTVFNVMRAPERLDVQVSEGSVLFDPAGQAITLAPGDALTVRENTRQIIRAKVPVEAIGGWRNGTLRFESETLATVSAAIRRGYGTEVVLEGDLSRRPFTGMIRLTGAADRDIPHLAALIGVEWRRNGEQWILAPRAAALR
ncbi:MAG: FecR domain-containing protein [Pseudomonadota bacterium]